MALSGTIRRDSDHYTRIVYAVGTVWRLAETRQWVSIMRTEPNARLKSIRRGTGCQAHDYTVVIYPSRLTFGATQRTQVIDGIASRLPSAEGHPGQQRQDK